MTKQKRAMNFAPGIEKANAELSGQHFQFETEHESDKAIDLPAYFNALPFDEKAVVYKLITDIYKTAHREHGDLLAKMQKFHQDATII